MNIRLERFRRGALLLTALVFAAGYATVGLVLLLAAAIWETLTTRRIPWQRTSLDRLLIAFVAVFAVSGIRSTFPGIALGSLLLAVIGIYLGYGTLSRVLAGEPDFLRPFLGAWVVGGIAAAAWGIALSRMTGRAASLPALHQNELATTLLTSLLLVLPGVSAGLWRRRVIMMGGMIIMTLALLLTDGRGAWLGVLAGAILFMILGGIRQTWRGLVVMLVVGIALGAVAQSESTSISSRIRSVFSLSFYTNRVRIGLAETAIAIFRDHPVTGTGLGTFARVHPTYRSSYYPDLPPHSSAHNVLLNMAAEGGVLGLVTFSGIMIAALAAGLRNMRRPDGLHPTVTRAAVVAAYAGLLLDQQFATTIVSVHLGTGFWFLTAALAALVPATQPAAAQTPASTARAHPAILIVSNGYGEDAVGNLLARNWTGIAQVAAFPLVGIGTAYAGAALLDPRRALPSGGFGLRGSWGTLWADLRAGAIRHWLGQRRALRVQRGRWDTVVAIGDVYCLWMAAAVKAPVVFVATAKSEYNEPHRWVERILMRRHAQIVFTRDQPTADALRRSGITARHVGNALMDTIGAPLSAHSVSGPSTVTLLPGSRGGAYDNIPLLLKLCQRVGRKVQTTFVCALAPSIDLDRVRELARAAGWTAAGEWLQRDGVSVKLTHGFGEAVAAATVVVGLAGTANEQAAGLGKPVVAFPGRGAQFTPRFLALQQRLLGDALVGTRDWNDAAEAVLRLLRDPQEMARRGEAGRTRMGPPGAVAQIAAYVNDLLTAG